MAHTKFRKTVIDAIFEEADLKGANFSGAIFQMTWLSKACLKEADFTNAIFSDDFLNSFTEADLTGAVFTNSKGLTQSDLDRAGCAHRPPLCLVPDYTGLTTKSAKSENSPHATD